jgi:3-dehydroquinate synthase
MNAVNVRLKDNSYKILIGSGILNRLPSALLSLKIGRDAVIITDRSVARLHGRKVEAVLKAKGFTVKTFAVQPGEKSKSASVAMKLIEQIARYDVDKKIFVIALGGGVVGDLAGFVAAVYKRGIPYVQVPTTLLAQIDSAIGGKVAIDLTVGKNLTGAFYQPKLVLSDVKFLTTLDKRQIRNGLAEAVKYGVILDTKLFAYLEKNYGKFLALDPAVLSKVVLDCSRIKADVVSKDEKETKGLRLILNFGHTLGHAVENAVRYDQYHHGEAVALGMRMAAHISLCRGLLRDGDNERLNILLSNIGLPEQLEGVSHAKILDAMRHDKKFVAGKNRFILAHRIGKVSVVAGIPLPQIKEAIQTFSA